MWKNTDAWCAIAAGPAYLDWRSLTARGAPTQGHRCAPPAKPGLPPTTRSSLVTVDILLAPEFNLVGVPLMFQTTTRARDLAEALLPPGIDVSEGPVASILTWGGSGYSDPWLRDCSDQPASNFEIEAGKGYFIRLLVPVPGNVWSVTGQPFAAPVALDLAPGYNLISVPFTTSPEGYDSKGLASAMLPGGVDISDGPVMSVLRWDGGYTAWLSDFPDAPAGVFPIEQDRGYFLRAREAVSGFLP